MQAKTVRREPMSPSQNDHTFSHPESQGLCIPEEKEENKKEKKSEARFIPITMSIKFISCAIAYVKVPRTNMEVLDESREFQILRAVLVI